MRYIFVNILYALVLSIDYKFYHIFLYIQILCMYVYNYVGCACIIHTMSNLSSLQSLSIGSIPSHFSTKLLYSSNPVFDCLNISIHDINDIYTYKDHTHLVLYKKKHNYQTSLPVTHELGTKRSSSLLLPKN